MGFVPLFECFSEMFFEKFDWIVLLVVLNYFLNLYFYFKIYFKDVKK